MKLPTALFLAALLLLPLGYIGTAQKKKKKAGNSSTADKLPFELTETSEFFYEFCEKKAPEPRGEFETKAEYEARLPKPWDTARSLNLWVQDGFSYKYDIDNERLIVCAGEGLDSYKKPAEYMGNHPGLYIVTLTNYSSKHKNDRVYSEDGMRQMYFEEVMWEHYLINVQNAKQFPTGTFNDSARSICIDLSLPPKEAKRLSGDAAVLVSVRPASYERSFRDITSFHNPRYGDAEPQRFISWVSIIDVVVDKVFVYDRGKRKVIHEIIANPLSTSQPGE